MITITAQVAIQMSTPLPEWRFTIRIFAWSTAEAVDYVRTALEPHIASIRVASNYNEADPQLVQRLLLTTTNYIEFDDIVRLIDPTRHVD